MTTRRKFGMGIAAMLAAQRAPAALIRSLVAGRHIAATGTRLPYDAELEYLESTGTQYIDTGIQGSASLEISCRFKRTDIDHSVARLVYGAYVSGAFIIGCGSVNSNSYFAWYAVTLIRASSMLADINWHDSVLSTTVENKFFKLDGEIVGTSTTTESYTGTMPIILFGRNPSTSSGTRILTPCSISSFSIKDTTTGQLLIDYIPVRFTNELGQTEGAMFDRANPTVGMDPDGSPRDDGLYRNRGTGSFIFGHVKARARREQEKSTVSNVTISVEANTR